MGIWVRTLSVACAALVGWACGGAVHEGELDADDAALTGARWPSRLIQPNEHGVAETIRAGGGPVVDLANPFFQPLGTNGRSCSTCHVAEDGFALTPAHVKARFDATGGRDPLFSPNDGTNSPNADRSTLEARRNASSLLLSRGLIRVGIGMPSGADFDLVSIDDPYGFASAGELSMFRRPLPSINLDLATVMWDGRETFAGKPLPFDLADQAASATLGHGQAATPPTQAQLDAIVDFETHLFTAQIVSDGAGLLSLPRAGGGPFALSQQTFYPGINDLFGDARTGAPFDPEAIRLFHAWTGARGARGAIARGEALFNHHPIQITGVAGINDNPAFGSPATVPGTCTTCHDAPNLGSHSVSLPLDLGIADPQPAGNLEVSGLPIYTFRSKASGALKTLTDPGRALLTGHFADLGKFKGPNLRGLSGRAPYFHNGSAHSLADVVDFYNARFGIGFTAQEKRDLIAFLSAL